MNLDNEKIRGTLIFLRLAIGWHFLYEGLMKLYNPDWTAFGYLASAQGPLGGAFFCTGKSINYWLGRHTEYASTHYCRYYANAGNF